MDPALSECCFPVVCHLYDNRYDALSYIPGSQVFAAGIKLLHTTQCVVDTSTDNRLHACTIGSSRVILLILNIDHS